MKTVATILFAVFIISKTTAQVNPVFRHLNTTNGLSYIGVNNMSIDKKGNLWIATGNGLNMFNGKKVDKYYVSEFPQMNNNSILNVTCDNKNRVWMLAEGGNVSMLDENRQMHRIALYEKDKFIRTRWLLQSQGGNIILLTENGHYAFKPNVTFKENDSLISSSFASIRVKGFDTLMDKRHRQVFYYDDNNYLLLDDSGFFKINYNTREVERKYSVKNCNALVKWKENELLYYDRVTNEIKSVNLVTLEASFPFKNIKDQYGKPVRATFAFGSRIDRDRFIFTTVNAGIYIYDAATAKIYNYKHHIGDPGTIINNSQLHIATGYKGWVFIACNPNGISYFDAHDYTGNQQVFIDEKGNAYDGYISGIATKDNNTYYVGTATGLMQWKRSNNVTRFVDIKDREGLPIFRDQEVVSIAIDNQGKIWITSLENGLIVIDDQLRLLKHIRNDPANTKSLKIKKLTRVFEGPDGYMWLCGRDGVARVHVTTYQIDNFENHPLQQFDSGIVTPLRFTDRNSLLIPVPQKGLYHYDLTTKQLTEVTAYKPFAAESFFDIHTDTSGNIYVANRKGLRIFYTDGRMKHITSRDGMVMDRSEGILRDKHNRIWIGNDIGLSCFVPADSTLRTFDVRYGLSIYGFRVGSYFQMPSGEFFFGTPHGLQYFHPDSMFNKNINLNVSVTKIETKKIVSGITGSSGFNLAATDNQVTFHFGTVDYSPYQRTYYQYKLVDLDKEWITVADQNSVRYNSLPPGKYIFKVRVSHDNKNWQEADNEVMINIALPFYVAPWFKVTGVLFALAMIAIVLLIYRREQIRRQAALETELLITRFASQINRHKNVNELLWDITKNCISRLNFEDCVIYLKDQEKNVLVQHAAYGPKSPVDFTIHQPIEIPVGKGIVGTVAQTGKPELISNTDADSRYIIDDQKRLSELAVPIIIDGKVEGVIDSENRQRNFFTGKHLQVLSAVAALTASQMQLIRAEEDKQKATIELLENKRKAMESRLQSLRLQMNPHFLFNALNSIQQMILANEEMIATRYLSRFSKLLRMILVHSDKEYVSLKEELEILHLYVELESVRFKDVFKYQIKCDEEIDVEEVQIPTLLIQPFVENAIWHGLMHKEGEKRLHIQFTENKDYLHCVVEDNGVGRKKANEAKIASGREQEHTSKGIKVSVERLKTNHKYNGRQGELKIIDLEDEKGEPAGTRIEINFPIQN